MIDCQTSTRALIGSGGATPRLETYDAASGAIGRMFELPPGHSVYAVDISPDGRVLVLGTRRAALFWVTATVDPVHGAAFEAECCIQDGGVLAVRFVGADQAAVSTTAGGCRICRRGSVGDGQPLPTGDRIVCALLWAGDMDLVGLTTTGELLFWRLPNELIRTVPAVPPPTPSAVVRMMFWSAANALVWPSRGGTIALYDLAEKKLRCIAAHSGDFCAMTVLEERLVTIGAQDRRMKLWRAGQTKPVCSFTAPPGVISATALCNEQRRLLLVDVRGVVAAFSVEEDRIRLHAAVPSGDARTVVGPSPIALRAFEARCRQEKAARIAETLREKTARKEYDGIEDLYSRLRDLGGERESLTVRITECHQKDDLGGELRACAQLARLVSPHEHHWQDWLVLYGERLEEIWQLRAAYTLYEQVAAAAPRHRAVQLLHEKAECVDAVRTGAYCIDPGKPIDALIEYATLTVQPFVGRFLIRAHDLGNRVDARVDPEGIVAQYEQIRARHSDPTLPTAEYDMVYRIMQDRGQWIRLITLRHGNTGLQYGLQVVPAPAATGVVAMALFDADAVKSAASNGQQRNGQVLDSWKALFASRETEMWLNHAHRTVIEALYQHGNMVINDQIYPRTRRSTDRLGDVRNPGHDHGRDDGDCVWS